MKNLFKEEWDKIDRPETHPRSMRNAVKCEWEEFRGNVLKQDPKFVKREVDEPLYGDSTKARENLGWKPKVDFKNLVKMMVEADIKLLEKNSR